MLRNFDLIAADGYGELCSGSEREHEYAAHRRADARDRREPGQVRLVPGTWSGTGSPASAGFGLGLERFTRYIAGLDAVWQASAYPKVPGVALAMTASRRSFPAEPSEPAPGPAAARVLPDAERYGQDAVRRGRRAVRGAPDDPSTASRLVPPVFVPQRLEKLIDLGREPTYQDVDLRHGGRRLRRPRCPVYVSAFGSTQAASTDLGLAASRQAGRLGIPMVIGENVMPVNGYGRIGGAAERSLLGRISAYAAQVPDGVGGVAVQQSTEDADAEVWNLVYSDPDVQRAA